MQYQSGQLHGKALKCCAYKSANKQFPWCPSQDHVSLVQVPISTWWSAHLMATIQVISLTDQCALMLVEICTCTWTEYYGYGLGFSVQEISAKSIIEIWAMSQWKGSQIVKSRCISHKEWNLFHKCPFAWKFNFWKAIILKSIKL